MNDRLQADQPSLFCFGLGFSARHLIGRLDRGIWHISGTARVPVSENERPSDGTETFTFDGKSGQGGQDPKLLSRLEAATHILVSIPPDATGDPVLNSFGDVLGSNTRLRWIGYLSTVGVYGEHHGAWVDETTTPAPVSQRSRYRLAAEQQWQAFAERTGKRLVIFRLAGIYGAGRSAIDTVRAGRARRIIKEGQRFNRINVADIASVLEASMGGRGSAPILNVTDDEPAPPQDVIAYAAELLGAPVPPAIDFENADLSPMARSFYGENKQVRNDLLKRDLQIRLEFPTYREGLGAIARHTKHDAPR
ncbi:MAG: SDR family oxidoreductase [Hyphomicrobiaceae bacterium]|nr:SDR family oxidoreductase [Hyphomicrobiaceae bacterium]